MHRRFPRFVSCVVVGALALGLPMGSASASTQATGQTSATGVSRSVTAAAARTSTVASGLDIPWAMAPLPNGGALVTERNTGKIWFVRPGENKRVVRTIPGVVPQGEGGLLGIALSATFATDNKYFVYYTSATDNRVASVIYGSSAAPVPIVTGIRKGNIHNGGGLITRGKQLFIGTGDSGDRSLSQNTSSLNGKVLAVDYSGRALPTNKWGKVFSIGHRNVQGFTSAPDTSALLATELGQDTRDELNWIRPGGRNYGWPTCEGTCSTAGFTNPLYTWSPSEMSPSGISWARSGSSIVYYIGALRGTRLWRVKIAGNVVRSVSPVLTGTYGRIRGVMGRTDGSLWISTSNGGDDRVIRFSSTI